MRLPTRHPASVSPGVTGTARCERPTRALLGRLKPGDIAVIDHRDLDRATAQALVDAGVAAVVNAAPMVSGRYANLGPQLLADAGILMVDGIGSAGFDAVPDGMTIRLHEGRVYVEDAAVASGTEISPDSLAGLLEAARTGHALQLETFAHNSVELLRREEDLLLHGLGLPGLATRMADRPAVVVAPGYAREELRRVRAFVRDRRPVVIAVDAAADTVRGVGLRADVVVVSASEELPTARALKAAKDVVVCHARGTGADALDGVRRLGIEPRELASTTTTEDAALLLADVGGASLVVGVGLTATLEDFLDRQRPGLAGTYLTRLKLGPRLVDAAAVPLLYTGRLKPWHLLLAVLVGLTAVAAAIASTPVGHDWLEQLQHLAGLGAGAKE